MYRYRHHYLTGSAMHGGWKDVIYLSIYLCDLVPLTNKWEVKKYLCVPTGHACTCPHDGLFTVMGRADPSQK
jgi:hypothetical protein